MSRSSPKILAPIRRQIDRSFVWFRNRPVPVSTAFLRIYITMYVIQIAHLLEEWNTGFYQAFPALWGSLWFGDPGRYEPWSI